MVKILTKKTPISLNNRWGQKDVLPRRANIKKTNCFPARNTGNNSVTFQWVFTKNSWIFAHLKTIQDFSGMVLSSPIPSQIFPKFSPNFPKQQDQTHVVLSWSRHIGKCPPVPSCLVPNKTRLRMQTLTISKH